MANPDSPIPTKDTEPWGRQSALSSRRTVIPFKSDESCFAPWADMRPEAAPPCYRCGGPSHGAEFMEFVEVLKMTLAIVRWSCGCDGRHSFAIMPSALGVSWKPLGQVEPGVWKIKKLTDREKEEIARNS